MLESFSFKVAGPKACTLLIKRKKRLRRKCSPVNFAKFLRTSFLQNISGRLLQILVLIDFFCVYFINDLLKLVTEIYFEV